MLCWADFTIATRGYSFRKGQLLSSEMLTPKRPPRDFRVSARENSTKNCLYRFKWNLGGRNLADFASNSPRSLGQENSSILMTYSGCAGSPKPTCLSLQFGEMQGDFAKLQGRRRLIQAEGLRISMGWIGFSLFREQGDQHCIAGNVDLETPRRASRSSVQCPASGLLSDIDAHRPPGVIQLAIRQPEAHTPVDRALHPRRPGSISASQSNGRPSPSPPEPGRKEIICGSKK